MPGQSVLIDAVQSRSYIGVALDGREVDAAARDDDNDDGALMIPENELQELLRQSHHLRRRCDNGHKVVLYARQRQLVAVVALTLLRLVQPNHKNGRIS